MSTRQNGFYLVVTIILVLGMANFSIAAVDYPTKPITLICPAPPGGTGDLFSRAFAVVAEKFLGKPVVVVTKTGGVGQVGYLACLQAPPDGHTLSLFSPTDFLAIEWEILNGRKTKVTFDDFIPIASFNLAPYVIAVPYNSPWKTLFDMINDAKAKPDYYAFGSGGMYTAHHVCAEWLMRATGVKFRHVPYSGGGPAVTAVVGGHIDWCVATAGSAIPFRRGNKLRVLATFSNERFKPLEDVPTAKELGVDAWLYYFSSGIMVSNKTPMPIVEKLKELSKKMAEDKSYIDIIEGFGDMPYFMESEELSKYMRSYLERVSKFYKQLIEEGRK